MSCSCGDSCSCGSNCTCGKRNPDLGYTETAATTKVIIAGVAPLKTHFEDMAEMSTEGGHGCNCDCCGSSCSCDPCNC